MRTTERACPFCGVALALAEPVNELRLLSRLDRNRMVTLGAVLSAAGIVLGCREAPVAIYGAPAAAPDEVHSAAPPASSVAEPAPAPSPAPSVSAASEPVAAQPSPLPDTKPAPSKKVVPQPTASARPFAPAAAYGAPPSMGPSPGLAPTPMPGAAKPGK